MIRDTIISRLQAHEAELRQSGVTSLAVFGSVARGEERPDSDVDVVLRLNEEVSRGGFSYFGRLDALASRLRDIVGRQVDIMTEPVRKVRLRRAIARDSARAF